MERSDVRYRFVIDINFAHPIPSRGGGYFTHTSPLLK